MSTSRPLHRALLSFPSPSVQGNLTLGHPEPPVAAADDQRIAAVREAVPCIGAGHHLRRNLLSLRVEGIDAGPPRIAAAVPFFLAADRRCRSRSAPIPATPDFSDHTIALWVRPPSYRTPPLLPSPPRSSVSP